MINGVPLLDLAKQHQSIQSDMQSAINRVLQSQQYIMGDEVSSFELDVAQYVSSRFAVGLASGTDALTLTLRALDIGPGDEVIVPTFTFFATAESVLHVGATPVYVDIDARSYCIDVDLVEPEITNETKAIIPVHLFGYPADMVGLKVLAERHNLKLVEDNAQAFGACLDGQITGSFGDAGCISFFPSKNLGACGDGGMVVTNDEAVAEKLKMLRMHGWKRKNYPEIVGYNSRLDAIQAAILRTKLPLVEQWNEQRRRAADFYRVALRDVDVVTPHESGNIDHAYNLFVVRVNERELVQEKMRQAGVGTAVYYPAAIHQLAPCRDFIRADQKFPVAETAAAEVLAIPIFPGITREQQNYVVQSLTDALR